MGNAFGSREVRNVAHRQEPFRRARGGIPQFVTARETAIRAFGTLLTNCALSEETEDPCLLVEDDLLDHRSLDTEQLFP